MTPLCECAALHPQALRRCNDCDAVCCPSCAIEIESITYCRWCAFALTPAVLA